MPPVPVLHSPARVLRAYLLTTGEVFALQSSPVQWTVYALKMRATALPDDAVFVVNTSPVKDARSQRDGGLYLHHGIQIMVRSLSQEDGYIKCRMLEKWLSEDLKNKEVEVAGEFYIIPGFSVTSPTLYIGEEEQSERQLHTLNGTFTYVHTTP